MRQSAPTSGHSATWRAIAVVSRASAAGGRFAGAYRAAIVGLLGLTVLWAGVVYSLANERQAAIREAFEHTGHFARAFQEQITGMVRSIDQTLLYARASYLRAPDSFDAAKWSEHGAFLTNPAFQLGVIDKAGQLRASSFGPITHPVDLSDREHFRAQAASSGDRLIIGKPIRLHIVDRWAIQFTRRMTAADGSFAGVVSVSFDPAVLSEFYDSLHLGGGSVVTLIGTDGTIRARSPGEQATLGHTLADTPLMRAFAHDPKGSLTVTSVVDGVRRFYSYRAVTGYPLLVAVGMSEQDVLATWERDLRTRLARAGAVSIALLIVVVSSILHQTRLRRTEAALRESEARNARKSRLLEVTLQNMDQGIIKMDAEQVVEVVNRRMGELYDLPEDVATGPHTQPEMLERLWRRGEFGTEDADFAGWFARFGAAGGYGDDGAPREHVRPDGRVLEIRGRALPDGGAVQTFTDITERKRAETTLRAARDEADRSARAKAEFLAMMSHEIRSPMSGLLGIIELLRETRLDPEQLGMIELVHGSAASLLRIVNDILDFSKMEAGRLAVCPEAAAPRRLLAEIVEPSALAAADKGLRFTSEVAADVPDRLLLDPLRLRQILVNLLTNAIKFTAAGSVSLTVTRTLGAEGEPVLSFAVRDSGIGMSPEQLDRLFEPFSQADASTTKIFGGTGLGLTISRRLARLLGGDVAVASQPGVGSVFTLCLKLVPAADAAAAPVGDDAAAPVGDDATIAADSSFVGARRILVAEDQATNRWLIERQLERLGCSVTTAEHGRAALAALETATFDALISDCHMPELDGVALTRLIRAGEAARGARPMPILGLSADVSTEMRARCLAAGMNDVAGKPIDLRRLRAALAGLGRREPSGRGPADDRDAAVFDPATHDELYAYDAAEGRAWLELYLDAAAALIADLERDMAAEDRAAVAAGTHKLASASLAAGALRLGGLGRRLELAAATAPAPELHDMADRIAAAWRDARRAILGFVAKPEVVT